MAVSPIPSQYRSVTPNLVCRNAAAAIDFYKTVFGATVTVNMTGPDGKVMHAELRIGDTLIFVNDTTGDAPEIPAPGKSNNAYLHVYVPDVDTVYNRAVAAGARVDMPLADMFWGDRYGKITDQFGQQWGLATHIEDVTGEEMARRQKEFFTKVAAART
jgi:PhnB protein